MALTLIATCGASNANSYCTLEEANTYHEGHLYAATWNNATDANKKTALVMATRLLDQGIKWTSSKNSSSQALEWPRTAAYDPDGYLISTSEIPTFLKNATAEFARWLLAEDRTAEPDTIGFKKLSVGDLSLTVDKTTQKQIIPVVVMQMIRDYGRKKTSILRLVKV